MDKKEIANKSVKAVKTTALFIGEAVLAFLGVYVSGITMKNLIKSYLKSERRNSNK